MRSASLTAAAIALVMVGASFGVLLGNAAAEQGAMDSYGYVYTDSNAPAPSIVFDWVDINTTGTATGASGDDDWAGSFPIGFDFNFYGNRYSAFNVTTNGYIMFGISSSDYGNDNIPYSNTPNNFIAAYWDDMYADSNEIIYETVGSTPNMKCVVSFLNVTRLGSSNLMNFQIVLNETGDIWVNYLTLSTMYGSSATAGIENIDGSVGIEYGYGSSYLSDYLSIRYALPDVVISPSQTGRGAPGSTVQYTVTAINRQTVSDSLEITVESQFGWSYGLYDDAMNPLTDTDSDGIADTGTLAPLESKDLIVTVSVPSSPAVGTEFTYVNATSFSNPLNYFGLLLTTEVLPAWFSPPHSDYGDDTDSDGLFDYLVFDISVEAFTSGWYSVEGYLYTAGESYIAYDWAQVYMTSGLYSMELRYYGWNVRDTGADGPYHVHLTLYDPSWNSLGTDTHTTGSYAYNEFMEVPVDYYPPFSDNGVDSDADGLFDLMQVNLTLDVNYDGRIVVYAYLRAPDWTNLVTLTSDSTLSAGINTLEFFFDAWDVSEATSGGQFHVTFSLQAEVDGSLVWMGNYWYDTTSYDLLDFERPGAVFIDPFDDWTFDADGDSLDDFLNISIGVNVTTEGDYLITAEIFDWWGDVFYASTNLTHLELGDWNVWLSFPGWPIRYTGDNGPYDIHLTIKSGSVLCDVWDDSTAGYWWSDFEDAPGWFELPYSDAGVDTDGNSLYDYYTVTVGVNVTAAGTYRIYAELYDDWWDMIQSVSNVTLLSVGWNAVELRFSSWLINSNANSGMFTVELYLYDTGDRQMDSDTYTTVSYLYTDFEGLPAQFGATHEWNAQNDDADSLYERLLVNASVDVYNDGTFLVIGNLYDPGWNWVGEASAWADLTAGAEEIQISFPAWMINELGSYGDFYVELQLLDADMYSLDWDSFYTTELDPTDFATEPMSIDSAWASAAPSVDGFAAAGEWSAATVIDLADAVPSNRVKGELRIMNDADTLYIMIDAFGDLTFDEDDYASVAFDTDNDGVGTDGHDDQFVLRGVSWATQIHYNYDSGGWVQHCEPFDDDGLYGGMGFGPSPSDARDHRIYELAIPLSLLGVIQGDTLGFVMMSQFYYGLYDDSENEESAWPMHYPSSPQLPMYADLVLAENFPEPPPVTTAIIAGTAGSNGWYKSASTTVTLSASGGDGGVDYTEYRLLGGSWITYAAPFTVSGEGTHTYEFRSVDNAAQTETTRTLVVKIDTVAPVTASDTNGNKLWLNGTDATSGVGSVMYRVDGGAWTTYSGVITFTEPGTYEIEFYALDSAGNQEATQSTTVEVEAEDIDGDEPSNMLLLIGIGAAGIIAALLIVLLLLMKRRKGQQPANVPPQGMTMVPPGESPPPPPQA